MPNTSTNELLKSLQDHYANGKYEAGIDLLVDNRDSFDPAQFHYNLGTFYAKSNNMAAARYNLEKSLLSGAVGTEVYHNLRVVKSQLAVEDISNSPFIKDKLVDKGLTAPGGSFLLLTLVLILLTLLMYKFKVVQKSYVLAIALIISIVPVSIDKLYLGNLTYGVALERVNVYEGPSEIFDSVKSLEPGSKVIIGKIKKGWFFISNPIDASGWIKKDSLALY